MFAFIIPYTEQYIPHEENTQTLPEAYGPYETRNEAIGAAIDLLRVGYDQEPSFTVIDYGETLDNAKLLIKVGEEVSLGATINRLY